MSHLVLALLLLVLLAQLGAAQDSQVLPGYGARLGGEVLEYHSPLPEVGTSLLVRSLDAERSIAWETAPVPTDLAAEHVELVWMFGLQVTPDRHAFAVHVDGRELFRFENPVDTTVRDWTVPGPPGAPPGTSLRFRATTIDRFGDLMGFATLSLPAALVTPGEPVRVDVVGESAGSRAWYMTFQAAIAERASLAFPPAVLRHASGPIQHVALDLLHLGAGAEVRVEGVGGLVHLSRLELGGNRIELPIRRVETEQPVSLDVWIDGELRYELAGTAPVVRPWSIDLVQHTHTDVGYTRPQTEILPEHLRFIDTALDLCDATDHLPDDARFRWTCETSWSVQEYLENRTPEQIERLRQRVAEGRIEVTGMYLNLSDVVDEASYMDFLAPIGVLRDHGLPVRTAMHNDINGAPWCLADQAADLGLEFLTMGQHGHRALVPFEVPTCFWWQAPSGNRLLAFRADHYQTGNFWGVHTGRVEAVEDELLRYLTNLEAAGYPHDRIAVQHSGYPTDNSPPSSASSRLVADWNERYLVPRLRNAVAAEFPAFVRDEHGDELDVLRAAWPDWWSDGHGSAPRETAAARLTQAQLAAVETLLAFERLHGVEVPPALTRRIEDVREDLLFYGEHTFGAAESITEPFSENSVVQWAEKAAYAWDAVKRSAMAGEAALGRLVGLVPTTDTPQLVVFNGLAFARSGLLELYADHELLPVDRPFRLVDDEGGELAVQLLRSRAEGSYWAIACRELPAFGLRAWRVEVEADAPPPLPAVRNAGTVLATGGYRIEVDPATGALASWRDLETGRELVDPAASFGFGLLVHETLGNREQLEAFGLEDYARGTPTEVVLEGLTAGPVWDALALRGELPGHQGPGGVRWEYRLFHGSKRLELHVTLQKRRVFEPEALYVSLPFAPLRGGELTYDTLGGVVRPADQLIPGTATDWQVMQSFVALTGDGGQVLVASDQVPLIQLGGLHTGRFAPEGDVPTSHVYPWVMNNYWTTNFAAAPEGEYRFALELTSTASGDDASALRFGQASRLPLLGRLLPAGDEPGPLVRRSALDLEAPGLAVVAVRPTPRGLLVQVREVLGRPASLPTATWAAAGVTGLVACDGIGRPLADADPTPELGAPLAFAPFETRFIELVVAGD